MALRFDGLVEMNVVFENCRLRGGRGGGRGGVSNAGAGRGGVTVATGVVQIPVEELRLLLDELPLMRLE